MGYVIAVYRSRTVAMQAYTILLKKGIAAALVSTPRAANVGCGLSVRFACENLKEVAYALRNQETFEGFFRVQKTISGTIVARL